MLKAEQLIRQLNLVPHPEGGYYCETYRSSAAFDGVGEQFPAGRNYATAIYFLLLKGRFSAFHRIQSDEMWHYYTGDPVMIIEITGDGKRVETILGPYIDKGDVFQYTVKAGHWFAADVVEGGHYTLTGCTVAPGFDFRDFELAEREELIKMYPHLESIISNYTRTK
ncbi:MAG TPA: cupin domain-containing protein [Bacteroidia bacterium]|nr:cupin domain-containing protein [Bacteroidia bacterium]